MITHQEYQALCQKVWEHNHRYYVESNPLISDQEFDQLLQKIERIEKQHPEWITEHSPTQRVGESLSAGFTSVTHTLPMLSLANTYSKQELQEFFTRMEKLLDTQQISYCCELKMDGVACTARFEKGKFVQGLTRGNGRQGDDITHNMRCIANMPLQIYGAPEVLELRGEAYMSFAGFAELNASREKEGLDLFANPRNATSGSLKLLDPKQAAKRPLSIAFYGIAEGGPDSVLNQSEVGPYLRSLSLPTLLETKKVNCPDQVLEFAEQIQERRSSLPFAIDGLVIKVDRLVDHSRIGATNKHPRWAVAYKFSAEKAETDLLQITVQVGRTGVLTPVAELTPVFLAGSTIQRATLHNEQEVQRKDIRVGDRVWIEKGGDVIPKVLSVVLEKRGEDTQEWKMPQLCPVCQKPVVKVEGEVAVRCPNTAQCPAQTLGRLEYFVGKGGLDIEHLGPRIVEQLVEKGWVQKISDFFALDKEQLLSLEGFQQKAAERLFASLQKAKTPPLARLIMALGIPHVGSGIADLLARFSSSLECLFSVSKQDLVAIDGVGERVADAVVQFFADPETQEEIQKMKALGVSPLAPISSYQTEIAGKVFVLTGSLQRFTRSRMAELIKERGGKVSSSVSKKTDYVVAGESPGSKKSKAEQLGVCLLAEQELLEMMNL